MKIPILDLTRQYEAIRAEIEEGIRRVIQSGRFILGQEVEFLESEVAEFCDVKHAIGVASGTDALLLSLKALGIGPGHGVIVPSFTFFATAGAVHNVGATPIFCDINPRTYNLDPDHVRYILSTNHESCSSHHRLGIKIKAIIPVHLYGQMVDMDEIMTIASKYSVNVIEDGAQSIGAVYKNQKAGSLGHTGCFSFFPTKNLGAYGDGGMVITNDDELAERIRLLRVHGSKPKYYHRMVGYNSRLDEIQAAILRAKLPKLVQWTAVRQKVAAWYDESLGGIRNLNVPFCSDDRSHIFHQYTIRVLNGKRDALRGWMEEQGIGTEIYYPLPLHLQECFHYLGYREGDLPESERASREVLSLPMFPEITLEEVVFVTQTITRLLSGKGA